MNWDNVTDRALKCKDPSLYREIERFYQKITKKIKADEKHRSNQDVINNIVVLVEHLWDNIELPTVEDMPELEVILKRGNTKEINQIRDALVFWLMSDMGYTSLQVSIPFGVRTEESIKRMYERMDEAGIHSPRQNYLAAIREAATRCVI